MGVCRFLFRSNLNLLGTPAVLRNFPGKCVCEQTNLFCKVRSMWPIGCHSPLNNDYCYKINRKHQQRLFLNERFVFFNITAHGARPYSRADHSAQHTQSSVSIACSRFVIDVAKRAFIIRLRKMITLTEQGRRILTLYFLRLCFPPVLF